MTIREGSHDREATIGKSRQMEVTAGGKRVEKMLFHFIREVKGYKV